MKKYVRELHIRYHIYLNIIQLISVFNYPKCSSLIPLRKLIHFR